MTANPLDRVEAVVIGTSAGGIDALGQLLPALPATLRVPILIVLHLPRDRPSLLPEIFQHRCAVPVREAHDKDRITPGVVYFAPPDYHLLVDSGPQLALSVDEAVNFSRPSVDALFESAADIYGARLLAVLLTGASADGAVGLAAVHAAGGLTMVQRADEAQVPTMVEAALVRLTPDWRLPLAEIAGALGRLTSEDVRS
jgi:two-component system chemotaxis response regulator CheB